MNLCHDSGRLIFQSFRLWRLPTSIRPYLPVLHPRRDVHPEANVHDVGADAVAVGALHLHVLQGAEEEETLIIIV